jgi:hypothetical protein
VLPRRQASGRGAERAKGRDRPGEGRGEPDDAPGPIRVRTGEKGRDPREDSARRGPDRAGPTPADPRFRQGIEVCGWEVLGEAGQDHWSRSHEGREG